MNIKHSKIIKVIVEFEDHVEELEGDKASEWMYMVRDLILAGGTISKNRSHDYTWTISAKKDNVI